MTKSKLLNIGIVMCKFTKVIFVLLFLLLAGVFVHYQINPTSYKNVDINLEKASSGSILGLTTRYYNTAAGKKLPTDAEIYTFDKLEFSSLCFNFIKYAAILFFSFMCIRAFQNVIESVKEIKTFQKRNISSFRNIGKYFLIISALSSYYSYTFVEGGIRGIYISYMYITLALVAYIMAEVFSEGNRLSEENELTV